MARENLLHLALKVLAVPAQFAEAKGSRQPSFEHRVTAFPAKLQGEIDRLYQDVREAIPNDFDFDIFFETDGIVLEFEYVDGNVTSGAGNGLFTSRKSMLKKLRCMPWDDMRAELIRSGGAFEELVSKAADRPVNIPSSEEAARRYGHLLVCEIGKNRRLNPRSPFTLIIARGDLGIASQQFSSRGEVVFTIADRMTTQNDILMVLEQGAQWSFDEIEAAKREAVEQLGPISRAKAERRIVLN